MAHLPNLTILTFWNQFGFGGPAIVENFDWLPRCKSLVRVSLLRLNINDNDVANAIKSLKNLEDFNLGGCVNLNGEFVTQCQGMTRNYPKLVVRCSTDIVRHYSEFLPRFMVLTDETDVIFCEAETDHFGRFPW